MMKEFKLLIVCIAAVCLMASSVYADGPQQSTTTSTPPMETKIRDFEKEFILLGAPPTSPVIIPGTTDYLWRHGCGPTAVGNVVGYYDTHGYNDLITGDANTQTNDVNQAMASGGDAINPYPPGSEQHYEDYARPEDAPPILQQDDYLVNPPPTGRNPHANNCIGDYQNTSKSTSTNYYGWSWSTDIGPSFVNYVNQRNASYNPTYIEYSPVTGKALTWAVLTNEINNNRPMVFLVDTDGDNQTDHFVAVVGYDAPTNQYGCRDSWLPAGDIRWETFQSMGSYQPWSIWGGWSFQLGQPAEVTKYEQLPDMTYYGMDIRCDRKNLPRILADDFPCSTTGPITKVRIWGSWKGDIKGTINNIHLSIHSDDPAGPGGPDQYNTYSKPAQLLWSGDFSATDFTETVYYQATSPYEWWWDPNAAPLPNNDKTIWQYEIRIDDPCFIQQGTPTNPITYWLDAYAEINSIPSNAYFGWKTSEIHWNDDAVRSIHNGDPWMELRYPPGHPRMGDSIDLSFAIITGHTEPNKEPNKPKWCQGPDLSTNGLDVMASDPLILADDFECNKTTKITDITVWGSWKYDYLPYGSPNNVSFTLSIHSDMPASHSPSGYSMPNEVLWYRNLTPSEVSIEKENINEGWYDPYYSEYYFPGDTVCWKYVFHIPEANAFCQQGEPNSPIVYWLDVKAYPSDTMAQFGWKSSINHWNDDAVYTYGSEPDIGWWYELRYPSGHPLYYQSIDLAFAIDGNKPCEPDNKDFGDAPDGVAAPGYPTLLINNGAQHIIDGVTFMGALVDAEGDGQPTANADGDDLNPPALDDEDGVVIPVPLIAGQAAIITVTASVPGALDAWIDFGADSSWAQAGDQIAAALPLGAGGNSFGIVVPATATLGQTYARFRFSTAGGLQPFGLAPDGEVEDYTVIIEPLPDPNLKYLQPPDLTETGVDVRFDRSDGITRILADDFPCTTMGRITGVKLWGSWLNDLKGTVQMIHLSIHSDVPIGPNNPSYSKPGQLLWQRDVIPSDFNETLEYTLPQGQHEWWWDPYIPVPIPFGDTQVWRYNIHIPWTFAFVQQGEPNNPKVYWLDAWAIVKDQSGGNTAQFGWKSSRIHWNDDAVYDYGSNNWLEMRYPPGHPYSPESMDLAFEIRTELECYAGQPDYAQWVDASKPECWCYPRQCHGDGDGLKAGGTKTGYYYVDAGDLNLLTGAWKVKNPPKGPGCTGTMGCADFDHKKAGGTKTGYYRVDAGDLNILTANWKVKEPPKGPGVPPDCPPGNRVPH
jgi:hypothetical protein